MNAIANINDTLLALVREGNLEAEGELLRLNRGLILDAIRRVGNSSSALDRDDLVQEASVVFLRAVRAFDPSRGFQLSTLATVAMTRHLQRIVALKRNQPFSGRVGNLTEEVEEDDTPDGWDAVVSVVKHLPPKQRQAVEMVYGLHGREPMSTREVAGILGVGESQVRNLLYLAYDRVRSMVPKPN